MTALASKTFFFYNFSIYSGLKYVYKWKQKIGTWCLPPSNIVFVSPITLQPLLCLPFPWQRATLSYFILLTFYQTMRYLPDFQALLSLILIFHLFWPKTPKSLGEFRWASGFKKDVSSFPPVFGPPGHYRTQQSLKALLAICSGESWTGHLTLNHYNSSGFLRDREKKYLHRELRRDYCGVICIRLN